MREAITILLLGIMISPFLAAGSPDAGKQHFSLCISCHGPKGQGMKALNAPAIAGQEAWYLMRQLQAYREGMRGTHPQDLFGAQMRPMSLALSNDAAVKAVATFVAELDPIKPEPSLTGDAAKGKALYAVCASCHGQDGKGLKALNAPNLTIQQDWYLVRQLQYYREGIRGTHPKDLFGAQMRPMSQTLTNDQAVKDVVAYILTLAAN